MENNNNDNKPQGNQLQLDLSKEVAQGVYSNFAVIAHSSAEFVLDFAQLTPGIDKAIVKSRVIMVPEHVKRLLHALQENVVKYEKTFGRIVMPDEKQRTINPFTINNGGEA